MQGLKRKKTGMKKSFLLIWLCWLAYMCSYLGKVNYSANITQIESFYKVSHAEAGMVSTFFFFAYGAGQIFNGIFCGKYNIKYVVFGGLMCSSLVNFLIAITNNFTLIKFFWFLNGASLSVLWPCMIGLLGKTLKKEDMASASAVMGTTVAIGTLIIYGLSAIFALFDGFRFAFLTPAIVNPCVAFLWLFSFDKLTKNKEGETDDSLDISIEETPKQGGQVCVEQKKKMPKDLLIMIIVMCVFAVATNLVADGLTTWVPSILKETYHLPDSLSILLTLCLPLLAVFGNVLALILYKKYTKSFVGNCCVLFAVIGLLILAVIGLLQTPLFIFTLICFAIVRFFAGSSNSTITSICPLFLKGKVDSGRLAGILNGCCYLGSTISSYGLGVIADSFGWNTVFYLLFGVCVFVVAMALVYFFVGKIKGNKEN